MPPSLSSKRCYQCSTIHDHVGNVLGQTDDSCFSDNPAREYLQACENDDDVCVTDLFVEWQQRGGDVTSLVATMCWRRCLTNMTMVTIISVVTTVSMATITLEICCRVAIPSAAKSPFPAHYGQKHAHVTPMPVASLPPRGIIRVWMVRLLKRTIRDAQPF